MICGAKLRMDKNATITNYLKRTCFIYTLPKILNNQTYWKIICEPLLPNIPNSSSNQSPNQSLPDTSTLPAKPAPISLNKRERGAVLWSIIKKLSVFAKPYHSLIMATLLLTVVGSFAAQVNAFVLRYTVDHLTEIL